MSTIRKTWWYYLVKLNPHKPYDQQFHYQIYNLENFLYKYVPGDIFKAAFFNIKKIK